MIPPKGWHSRGYLPHLDVGGQPQFVTWRLADALPNNVLNSWQEELAAEPESVKKTEVMRRIEKYCDAGAGDCHLADPKAARIVQQTLLDEHARSCTLHSWVVMPNHVHAIVTPLRAPLDVVMKRLNGVSSRGVNR